MEPPQSPLVVFGPDHIDTSRAEMLVQCLNDKIKEKRFKLQKLVGINEEKKKRSEMMKNEKLQLTTKLANIEQENSVREQQLQSEQTRLKELQFNIQMLDDHHNSIKRDCINEERKYEQEKSILINKFERIKQQWIDIFKPQYEQSKVYQYLKQGDLAYNSFVKRNETLLNTQKLLSKDYFNRRQQFCNENKLQLIILSIAKYFLSQRNQLIQIQQMKEKLIEFENKQKQLIESKNDKMKAWESVYTQPNKRDLMDFCLQTNIDQALTLSFHQIQQDIWSQPMTPTVLTPQNEYIEFVPEEQNYRKSSGTFQSSVPISQNESMHQLTTSTITIVPNTTIEPSRSTTSSVHHLTTAIDDDDDELFSLSRRKLPIALMEQMTINDSSSSTQAFVVSTTATNSNIDVDKEVASIPFTQGFTTNAQTPTPTPMESTVVRDLVTPTINIKMPGSVPIASPDTNVNQLHSPVAFQLAPPRIPSRPLSSVSSSIQPQVTSNDVQQMLLTFSPDPSSIHEEQPQPMEDDSELLQQQQQQQRPAFSIASSIESTTSTEDGYTGFNYNFGFDGTGTGDTAGSNTGFTSPISFGNWGNLGSPTTTSSNDQFSSFLQQTNNGNNGIEPSFSFGSFNYGDLGSNETSTDGAFGSFFFGNDGNPANNEQTHGGQSN